MNISTKFDLGDKVKCRITGFEGVVSGMSFWLTGCTTYGLRPQMGDDGKYPEMKWFDEPQLELVEAEVLKLDVDLPSYAAERDTPAKKRTGGPLNTTQSAHGVD